MNTDGDRRGLRPLLEGIAIAGEAITANKVRSILTVIGVAVGVSVVVAIGAIMTGIRSEVLTAIESAGPENFVVTRFNYLAITIDGGNNRPPWWGRPIVEPEEAEYVEALPAVSDALYDVGNFNVDIVYDGDPIEGTLASGSSAGWAAYQTGDFVSGRDFTPAEVEQNRAVVIITESLAEALFGERDPLGRRIRVTNGSRATLVPFTVIGIYRPEENIFSTAFQNWAVFPWTAAVRRLRQSQFQAQILVVPVDSVTGARAQDDVTAAMRGIRGLGPRDENTFNLMSSDQIAETFNRITGIFFLVILLLASAGLLVGGVGVIGIMLISVTERTREIGVRKALGATRREVLWQFLVEASCLTVGGAAMGLLIGWGMARGVARFSPLPAAVPVWAVVAALGMAAFTGMLFGLLPAYRASRLEPVVALRFE